MILPSDHLLAERKAIDPHDLVGETFIGISEIPRVLRAVIDDYLKRTGIEITPHLEIDNFAMAISLVASTRGVALLPVSAETFLAVVCRQPSPERRRRRPSISSSGITRPTRLQF